MKTILIAEAGVNHNGSVQIAHQMIDAAKNNGATCVKFQTHLPSKEMVKDIKDHVFVLKNIYDLIENTSLRESCFKELKQHADDVGIIFMSTPYCPEAVDLLQSIDVDRYKVGSGETDDFILLDKICKTGKEIYISTGMSNGLEIDMAVNFLKQHGAKFTLLQCTSEYPCPYEKINLNVMSDYAKKYTCPVGLSDHSISIYPAIAAVALGASVIEKHFTLDRDLPGTDHKSSILPHELKMLSEAIDIVEKSTSLNNKTPINEEVRQLFRHGITASRDIHPGDTITLGCITSKRPLIGIPSSQFESVLGKTAIRFIKIDTQLQWMDFDV